MEKSESFKNDITHTRDEIKIISKVIQLNRDADLAEHLLKNLSKETKDELGDEDILKIEIKIKELRRLATLWGELL